MKRKIKIEAGYTGVLPVANYSNVRPSFAASMEYEADFSSDAEFSLAIEAGHQELQGLCYQAFEREADKARILKVQQDLKNFRFYETSSGEKWPSLTSFLFYDKDFFIEDDELKQYASQGNLIDAEFKNFVKTGVYKSSSELIECTADRFILKTGSLQLSLDGWDIPGFLKKYPIEKLKVHEKPLENPELKYGCLPDLEGVYNGIPTVIEIKRTKSETDNFKQLAGQAKCKGMEHIKQMMIIPINDKTKQGYSAPSVSTDIEKYYELCKFKRVEFRKIYGV